MGPNVRNLFSPIFSQCELSDRKPQKIEKKFIKPKQFRPLKCFIELLEIEQIHHFLIMANWKPGIKKTYNKFSKFEKKVYLQEFLRKVLLCCSISFSVIQDHSFVAAQI